MPTPVTGSGRRTFLLQHVVVERVDFRILGQAPRLSDGVLSVSLRKERGRLFLGGIAQDSAYGSPPDPYPAGDLRFGDAGAM